MFHANAENILIQLGDAGAKEELNPLHNYRHMSILVIFSSCLYLFPFG